MPTVEELCRAIEANDIEMAEKLLAAHGDLADSNEGTPPPIHWAIYQDRWNMVELLLDHGADIERRDRDRGATPLDYAIVYARPEIIKLLVSRGANLEGRLQLAVKGASGGFEAFGELPTREQYEGIVELLAGLGARG